MKKILFALLITITGYTQSPTPVSYLRLKELPDLTATNFSAPSPYAAFGTYQGNLYYLPNGGTLKQVTPPFSFPPVSGHMANEVLLYNGSGGTSFSPLKTVFGNSLIGSGNVTFDIPYSGVSPTTITVGGLVSGTNITGQTYGQIIQSIVAPYINPVFTSFVITAQNTTVEVGTTLSGSKTFTWSVTLNSGVVSTIDIFDNTASSTLLSGTPNDGSQAVTVTTIQLNSNGATQSWKGIGNNSSPLGTFNSSNFVVTSRYLYFYGASSATPTNSATVRALPSSAFYTGATTFTLNSGTSLTKFDVALPPGVSITQVIDLDALNANITSQYVSQGAVNVNDAGGTTRLYTLFEMNVGVPYSTNHRHQITTN